MAELLERPKVSWFGGWRTDRKPWERVYGIGKDAADAYARMSHNGAVKKIYPKLDGPYGSRKEAEETSVPLPSPHA